MSSEKKRGFDVQGFLKNIENRSGRKPGMVNSERPPGTPPPPGTLATHKNHERETGVEVEHSDGSKEYINPEQFKRQTLKTVREGGKLSESAKKAIKEGHPITKEPIQEIRLIGNHRVKVINNRSQLGRNRRRGNRNTKRLRDNTSGLAERKKLYQKMGFVSQETGKEGAFLPRKNKE